MKESDTKYRVVIRELGEDAGRPIVVGQHRELSLALYYAITANDPCRMDQVIADLIGHLLGNEKFYTNDSFFAGQTDAVMQMIESARKISDGWEEHDRQLRKQWLTVPSPPGNR